MERSGKQTGSAQRDGLTEEEKNPMDPFDGLTGVVVRDTPP